MYMSMQQKEIFLKHLNEMNHYKQALELMTWDRHTSIPNDGLQDRLEIVGFFTEKLHQLQTSDKMVNCFEQFLSSGDPILQQAAQVCKTTYEQKTNIPKEEYKAYAMLCSESEAVWHQAKQEDNFKLFEPFLEKIVSYKQRFAAYVGYESHIYDALLQEHEPGLEVKEIDEVFADLRPMLIDLLQRIKNSEAVVDASLLRVPFAIEKQKSMSLALLERIGYKLNKGRMDTSAHPYTFGINPNDVRISTYYDENDFTRSVFSAMHEGGHGLYEQNFGTDIQHTLLAEASSMGIHESQSLLWESFISKNKLFWESNQDVLKAYAPQEIQKLDLETFYRSLHQVSPSPIRLEADEVSYPLHIMIRYELEKDLISGKIKVSSIPEAWREKSAAYLGVTPSNDTEGVLQDIHWSSGDFGYFPSYALGYIYAAQLYESIDGALNMEQIYRDQNLHLVKEWLKEHIYQYGKRKTPLQLLKDTTGKGLQTDAYKTFLQDKYKGIYHL